MIKIKVSPGTCEIGDQIAADILNEYGALIAAKNTIINESILKNLASMNIDDFWVIRTSWKSQPAGVDLQLDKFRENYENSAEILEKLIGDLSGKGQPDVSNLDIVSNSIINEITYNPRVVQFIYQIREHDDYTFEHSLNVAFYSALICKWLNLNEKKTESIIKTGLLHDLGKVNIPIDLLNKKEKLYPKELEQIQKHAVDGYNLIKDIVPLDSDIKLGVLLHHERMDGSGYPNKYSGRQLNMNTKIVSIADTYDALTSDRTYKTRYTPFMALNVLMTEGLTSYDINILNTFVSNLIFHYVGLQVLLSTGEIGKVVHIPLYNITRPIVDIDSKLVDLSKDDSLSIVSVVDGNAAGSREDSTP